MKLRMTLLALLALGACKDKGETTEKPAAAGPLKIEALGLSIDAPAGTKISEMAGSQMLQGPGLVVSVSEAGSLVAESMAAEVEEAKDMYSATDVTQEEVEGGWHVTFQNKGGMGTNYWVNSHLTIDGKVYTCGTTASNKAQQDAALAACKTLKK